MLKKQAGSVLNNWGFWGFVVAIVALAFSGFVYWEQREGALAEFRERTYGDIRGLAPKEVVKELTTRIDRETVSARRVILWIIRADYVAQVESEGRAEDARIAKETATRANASNMELERLDRASAEKERAAKEGLDTLARLAFERGPK